MFQQTEVPTGIVAAVIGAPYFLYLLVRTRVS
jgi:iron complex transport system permease protein